jgi:hypothetical protein
VDFSNELEQRMHQVLARARVGLDRDGRRSTRVGLERDGHRSTQRETDAEPDAGIQTPSDSKQTRVDSEETPNGDGGTLVPPPARPPESQSALAGSEESGVALTGPSRGASVARHRIERVQAAAEVSESIGLGYHLGSAVERILVAADEGSSGREPLLEAVWFIERYVSIIENRPLGADIHAASMRLQSTTELIDSLRALAATTDAPPHAAVTVEPDDAFVPDDAEPASAVPELVASSTPAHPYEPSWWSEVARSSARWTLIVLALVLLVLVVTLIGGMR